MSIKLRPPKPDEERLSWCNDIEIAVCVENGLQEGKIDAQFIVLDADQLHQEVKAEDQEPVFEFVAKRVKAVRGFKDEDGKDWPEDEQLEFATSKPEIINRLWAAYFAHTAGVKQKKGNSANSAGRRSEKARR